MVDGFESGLRIERREEDQLSVDETEALAALLDDSFPDMFNGRVYFKQLPNFRFLVWRNEHLCGQVGVSHRIMRLGETPMRVFGVIDMCVAEPERRAGIGRSLLEAVIGAAQSGGADFVLLYADDPRIYEAHGFVLRKNLCRWLAIDEHHTLGVQTETLNECMMSLSFRDTDWPELDELDMMGYLF